MDELAQLTGLCSRLGATPAQAETMARQMIKRADQLAVERGQDRAEALAYLIRLVVEGRSGGVPQEFRPPEPPAKTQNKTARPAK